jgi:large subunit ribosomal protein L24
MKLAKGDKVMVIAGRDKGRTGTISTVLPRTNQIVIEGINIAKRHTKPSSKVPRGGILEIAKPLNAAKVMVIDPTSGLPARIGYQFAADGTKERVFKVSPNQTAAKKPAKSTKPRKSADTETAGKGK